MPIPSPNDYQPLDGDAIHTFIWYRALNNIHGRFVSFCHVHILILMQAMSQLLSWCVLMLAIFPCKSDREQVQALMLYDHAITFDVEVCTLDHCRQTLLISPQPNHR